MSHLRHSFFISNKPVNAGIQAFTTMQVGAFYLGCVPDVLPVKDGGSAIFFSLETIELYHSGLPVHNTMLINDRSLTVNGSPMNTQCIYYIEDRSANNIVIFNDLFLARQLLQALGLPVLYSNEADETLTFFRHVHRLQCGEQLNVRAFGNAAQLSVVKFSDLLNTIEQNSWDLEQSKAALNKSLSTAVRTGLEDIVDVSLALSGGVDSGSIAYFISRYRAKLKAYTVSTDWGDEYEAAKETADFLNISLELVHITKDEIISEVPNVIRYFHFTAPESIEIALVAHCLYKKLYERDGAKRMFFTGYGSDLLNAGVYAPFQHYHELRADCMRRVKATQLSNEFSNLAALNHGVKVYHPFWNTNVITTSMQVPAEFKVKEGQDKFYFREMMKGRLPDNTTWRKKLGAHHGTGLSQHLHNVLGDGSTNGYQQAIKNIHEEIFCYGNYDYHAPQTRHAAGQLVPVE